MRIKFFVILLLFSIILLLRYQQVSQPKLDQFNLAYYNNQEDSFNGRIVEPPEENFGYQKLVVGAIEILEPKKVLVQGKILVKTRLYPKFSYGEQIEVSGLLKEPPEFEDFSYKEYLKIDGIYSLMNYPTVRKLNQEPFPKLFDLKAKILSVIYSFRMRVQSLLTALLPEPHASLLIGIVFGIKKAYPVEIYESLRKAGVLHVIVASGFNISVVVGALMIFRKLLGAKIGAIFILVGIFLYAVLAGLVPPILRASLLGAAAVLSNLLGRQQHTLWWLALTAYLMLIINPLWLKSLSFQLSFLASLALLVIKPSLQAHLEKMVIDRRPYIIYQLLRFLPDQIRGDFLTTASVLTLTTPLIWWNFGQISLAALVVNSLVLWTIPPLMFLGIGLVAVGFVSKGLAMVLGYPVWLLLEYFLKAVQMVT